ncbi:dienelactone hydrolase family protein [Akkermansiaceae bacterium]|nr:dienelactone hydrolase family protein [Akkermansiaceae bacterium]
MNKLLTIFFLLSALAKASVEDQLKLAGGNASEISGFLETAGKKHGQFGTKAARFLVKGMPPKDLQSLKKDFLMENLSLALKARKQFTWAKAVPKEIFLNDVLPYASLDETRESWRPEFYEQCSQLVKDCKTATEAAQTINKEFFNIIKVHYNTGRKAPNQSPAESKALGMATCTGLSIILVDACRSVGVPARIAGTPLWANKRGNHTWIELYDGEWFFTGADEYHKKGLNRAWFTGDASKAVASDWRHAIWASSWKRSGSHFPMVWALKDKSVAAVNVTDRYAKPVTKKGSDVVLNLRVWDRRGGERIVAKISLVGNAETVTSKAGTSDLNDMATLKVPADSSHQLEVEFGGVKRTAMVKSPSKGEATVELYWDQLGAVAGFKEGVMDWLKLLPEERHLSVPEGAVTKAEAEEASGLIFGKLQEDSLKERKAELDAKVIKAVGKEMKFLEKVFGEAKEGERSLWISMHGGGGAPARVNDQQWQNQIRLYAPAEGIVVAPRAPTNTWNLWHEGHIDNLLQRLIENMVAVRGVNPNKIYLMGYSAGGDGVYQLAPRMADRFAAASMMAGHPNDANPLGLRNLPFMIFMGGKDAAYKRNQIAAVWGEKLEKLRAGDSGGYRHKVTIYKELGHWMNGKDREALPWMAKNTRNPWPKKVVWCQSNRTHDRFYWLSVPKDQAKGGQVIEARVIGQKIEIEAEGIGQVTLRLSDELLSLDKEVIVIVNGAEKFRGKVTRSVEAIWRSYQERLDPTVAASAQLNLKF